MLLWDPTNDIAGLVKCEIKAYCIHSLLPKKKKKWEVDHDNALGLRNNAMRAKEILMT